MVVGAFPVAKLGALLLKQVSKPLANIVKARAKRSPFFRTYICMPPAQFYHWAEVKMKMWSMNLGKPVNIPKLNENLAIDLGAELLGEGIIFTIAAGILILEYVRSSRKEAAREEERRLETIQMQNDLRNLYIETAKQDAHIKELVRLLHINMPDVKYTPNDMSQNIVPLYHKDEHKDEDKASLFSQVSGWVWSAIDLIVPDNDGESPNKPVVVNQSSPVAPAGGIKLEIVPSVSKSSNTNTSPGTSNNQSNSKTEDPKR